MNKLCLFVLWGVAVGSCFSQDKTTTSKAFTLDANYFYGIIPEHSPSIGHLITNHPEGIILSYNRKTFGKKKWQASYNYPDYGLSFVYQDMKNPYLGDNYSMYAHYNFYFLNRHLMLRVGQGIAYNTNPYDLDKNYQNNAYGSHIMAATLLMVNYTQKNIVNGFGFQGGISLLHYSNGNTKAPNTSTNSIAFNAGINYTAPTENTPDYQNYPKETYTEPIHYNFVFRGGYQSSDVIGLGQFPFYILSGYADKRISKKSAFWAGTEVFFSPMLNELINYRSIAYPEDNLSGNESSTRAGAFLGYQLLVGKLSAFVNLGYYYYYPYDFAGEIYNRLGLQHELFDGFFASLSVKSHAAKAEAAEFSIGYRL